MNDRNKGKEILQKILENISSVNLIENSVYKYYKDDYIDTIFQVCGLLTTYNVKQTNDFIKNRRIPWNIPEFDDDIQNEKIEFDFIETPFEKTESVIDCVCGSSNVMTFSKQLRSSDEGTSVIAICMSCKKRWIEGG